MNSIPNEIAQFIARHHVVSLACHSEQDFWAASCFYAFEREKMRLILLTNRTTHHGIIWQQNPNVVGTISAQISDIHDIEGIQFSATARLLQGEEQAVGIEQFYAKHTTAPKMQSDVWEIRFAYIKYTSNKVRFAEKQEWKREKS